MQTRDFPNGLTVKELKEIIADWAETYENGEPTEVWIETGWCLSSAVVEVAPLNVREKSADLILSSGAFESPPLKRILTLICHSCGGPVKNVNGYLICINGCGGPVMYYDKENNGTS